MRLNGCGQRFKLRADKAAQMVAMGLSLIFGVMRLVKIAHGDLIVRAAWVAKGVIKPTGLPPRALHGLNGGDKTAF